MEQSKVQERELDATEQDEFNEMVGTAVRQAAPDHVYQRAAAGIVNNGANIKFKVKVNLIKRSR